MSNITLFGAGNKQALPDYIEQSFADESNVTPTLSVPQLSIRGKLFRVITDGEEKILMKTDPDTGEQIPVSTMSIVVLDQGNRSSRAYYQGPYDPSSSEGPTCYSLDGRTPMSDSSIIQASACANCPRAVKGSKITPSGHASTECSLQRRLVVIPEKMYDFPALLLRLAATSAWDKENKQEQTGWYAWQQLLDFAYGQGVRHTAQLVIQLKFDITEYPKLLFKPKRFLNQDEVPKVLERLKSEEVQNILRKGEMAAQKALPEQTPVQAIPQQEQPVVETPPAPTVEKPKSTPKPKAAPKEQKTIEMPGETIDQFVARQEQSQPAQSEDDTDSGTIQFVGPTASNGETAPTAKTAAPSVTDSQPSSTNTAEAEQIGSDLDDILSQWGE